MVSLFFTSWYLFMEGAGLTCFEQKKRSYNLEQDLENSMLFKANSSFLCNWEKALSIYRVQPQNQDNFWHCIFPRQGITLSPSSTTSFPSPSELIARPFPPLSLSFSFDPTKERERFNVIRPPSHKRRNPHLAKGPPPPLLPQQLNRFRPRGKKSAESDSPFREKKTYLNGRKVTFFTFLGDSPSSHRRGV